MASTDPILIIGSGIGGLSLAQGLKKCGMSFHVYERDASSDYRPQGYRVRIHNEGSKALKDILPDHLWSLFQQTCPETKLGAITNIDHQTGAIKEGVNFGPKAGPGGESPLHQDSTPFTVDRATVRRVLLSGIESNVSFGKRFERYETIGPESIKAHFADGTSATGRLLVGADGVWSAVRRQYLPSQKTLDTKGRLIYGKTIITAQFEAAYATAAMERMSGATDPSTGIVLLAEPIRFPRQNQSSIPFPQDYVYWVLSLPSDKLPVPDVELKDLNHEQSAKLARQVTSHWHESLRALFEFQDQTQTNGLPLLMASPEYDAWAPDTRITLLGDAIHTMIPAAASGANTVLRDVAKLVEVVGTGKYGAQEIGEYESVMREYASFTIRQSAAIGQKSFKQRPIEECEVVS